MNEQDKVWDGTKLYDREEYINVTYPEMKANAKMKLQQLADGSYEGRYNLDADDDMWSSQLLDGVVPEYND